MATSLPFGLATLTPQTSDGGTGTASPFTNSDMVYGTPAYRQMGTDIQQTLHNGTIERYRQSVNYEVTFQTYGDDTGWDTTNWGKQNCKCECFEDDGSTPVGTAFYGTVRANFNAGDNTTTFTITGNATAVPSS